jgi:hypothetical protein
VVDAGYGAGQPRIIGVGTDGKFLHLPMMGRSGSGCKEGTAVFRTNDIRGATFPDCATILKAAGRDAN